MNKHQLDHLIQLRIMVGFMIDNELDIDLHKIWSYIDFMLGEESQ